MNGKMAWVGLSIAPAAAVRAMQMPAVMAYTRLMSTSTMRAAVLFWAAARIDLPRRLRCKKRCRQSIMSRAAPKMMLLTMGKVIPAS